MSVNEFKEYIKTVYNHLILGGSTTIPKGSTSQAENGDGNSACPDENKT